jgi:uncharacterized protein
VSEPSLPTRAEALDFLVKAGCSKGVIEHCKTVSGFAVKIARAFQVSGFNVDVRLVEVGALLHDIGRARTHSVDHGLVGGEMARSLRFPRSVVRIIERHVGGGIPKEEARKLGWPVKDYLPQTWEEKIVCYADKRVEGLGTVPMSKAIKTYVASLGRNHPAIDRIRMLHEEIVAVVGRL